MNTPEYWAKKIVQDAMLRQGSTPRTVEAAMQEAWREGMTDAANIVMGLRNQLEGSPVALMEAQKRILSERDRQWEETANPIAKAAQR